MNSILIADSGGSKTDWCYVDATGKKSFFTTESYHPDNWSPEFKERITEYWNQKSQLKIIPLQFFGAGCFNVSKADELTTIFKGIGFVSVRVKSDLHGAGIACYGNDSGFVAILGTGSVLFNWNQMEVEDLVGGKGHVEGDEGSGFYFGKLVVEAYENDTLTSDQRKVFNQLIDISHLRELIKLDGLKKAYANIPFLLRNHKFLFKPLHEHNILKFCSSHLTGEVSTVRILGGYAMNHREIIRDIMRQNDVIVEAIVDKPIEDLVERMVLYTE